MFLMLLFIVVVVVVLKSIKIRVPNKDVLIDKNETNVIRGISALFIIISHLEAWEGTRELFHEKIIHFIIGQLGGIGVLLFFFVSGYGIYASYATKKNSNTFLFKRIENVYLPYLFIKLIMLILFILVGGEYYLRDEIFKIISLEDWFVKVIMLQYLSFWILQRRLRKNKLIVLSVFVDCLLSAIFIFEERPLRWFNALWLFTFGFIVSEYEKLIIEWFKNRIIIKCIFLFGAFIICGTIFAIYKQEVFFISIFKIISGIFLCMCICGLLQKITLESKLFVYVGIKSLYYYIVHINMWQLLEEYGCTYYRSELTIILTVFISEILYFIYSFFKKRIYSRMRI